MSNPNTCLVVVLTILMTTNYLYYTSYAQNCKPSSKVVGKQAPPGTCDPEGATCCKAGESYDVYTCSDSVTSSNSAVLTLNNFEEGGDGGGASSCDERFHSNDEPVVALSTGWFNGGSRCGKEISVQGNGQTTKAKVVDQCDSTMGCDEQHGYQVPCKPNVVDASYAVWKALGVSSDSPMYGQMDITWTDAQNV